MVITCKVSQVQHLQNLLTHNFDKLPQQETVSLMIEINVTLISLLYKLYKIIFY